MQEHVTNDLLMGTIQEAVKLKILDQQDVPKLDACTNEEERVRELCSKITLPQIPDSEKRDPEDDGQTVGVDSTVGTPVGGSEEQATP